MSTKKDVTKKPLREVSPEDRQFILNHRDLPSSVLRERLGNRYTWQQIAWVKARATMKERHIKSGPRRTRRPISLLPFNTLPVLPNLNPNSPNFPSMVAELQQETKKAEKTDPTQALSSCQDAAAQASQICLSLMSACLHQENIAPAFKLCTSLTEALFQLHHGLFALGKWVKEQSGQISAENRSPEPGQVE